MTASHFAGLAVSCGAVKVRPANVQPVTRSFTPGEQQAKPVGMRHLPTSAGCSSGTSSELLASAIRAAVEPTCRVNARSLTLGGGRRMNNMCEVGGGFYGISFDQGHHTYC